MSTRTNVESSRRKTVSIESRVVPGTSETMTRSPPTSALRSDDFPTFGRPRIATLIASSPTGRSLWPGSRPTISSRRSPEPCPWSAEIGIGSPSPRRWNSSASRSRRGSSSLFASTSTGRRDTRRISASSSSPGVMPAVASTTRRTRSASSTACRACAAICGPNGPVSARSTPPVSMRRNVVPDHSHSSSLRSRVTPGVSWTTAVRVDVSRLINVDLPTFGKPTIATVPAISTSSAISIMTAASRRAAGRARARPRASPTAS